MQYILFDDNKSYNFLPFTFLRPLCTIRLGILTLQEKWESTFNESFGRICNSTLSKKFDFFHPSKESIFINSRLLPEKSFKSYFLENLPKNHVMVFENEILAFRCFPNEIQDHLDIDWDNKNNIQNIKSFLKPIDFQGEMPELLENVTDIFQKNGFQIRKDFQIIKESKTDFGKINDENSYVYAPENVIIEEGVEIRSAIINASKGPVYIGKDVEIQENSVIIGPCAILDHAVINIGAKIRQDTTIGPFCKVGGEISNVVFQGYSNKSHDGFLGNSVIGEWCNLGADTNCSNLKNNYSSVKIYDHYTNSQIDTKLQFCGLILGDHSKAGINTMFNTGTVAGVFANIFDSGFPPKFIPSFAWGGKNNFETFDLEKAIELAQKVMKRRNIHLDHIDIELIRIVFEKTKIFRFWE